MLRSKVSPAESSYAVNPLRVLSRRVFPANRTSIAVAAKIPVKLCSKVDRTANPEAPLVQETP